MTTVEKKSLVYSANYGCAFWRGVRAYESGANAGHCPYSGKDRCVRGYFNAWIAGWNAADDERHEKGAKP